MRIKVTHYGEKNDPTPDSNTRNWIGNHGNTLNVSSCALTQTAEQMLAMSRGGGAHQLAPGKMLKIVFDNRIIFYRTFDDRAPESDPRVDLFNPYGGLPCPGMGDYAEVTVVEMRGE